MAERNLFYHQQIEVEDGEIHVIEAGRGAAPAVVFLHGWPQSWYEFRQIMELASESMHAVALDLPGIGRSRFARVDGTKRAIASVVRQVIGVLGLKRVTLVGHDIGGQVTYAYLTQYGNELNKAVIIDVAVPGVDPWRDVLRNPHIWHFAFHNVPDLPELLVQDKQEPYFDYFYAAIAARPESITTEMRRTHAQAYKSLDALRAGFDWYRAFSQDAKDNETFTKIGGEIMTPLLYLRGDKGWAQIERYVEGFRASGVRNIQSAVINDCGHFLPEEQPDVLWRQIDEFISRTR